MSRDFTPAERALLEALGERVRRLRGERGLSRRELAARSGISERFVSELEAGRANISVLNLAGLSVALRVELTSLLGSAPASAPERRVIALLGLRGAGKSSVGRALADALGVPFHELDRLVEQEAGMRLSELFAIHGEGYFREVELTALRRYLAAHREGVLATGGSLVTSPEAYGLLQAQAHTIWLKATPEEHWQRVVKQGDLRPMAGRPAAMAELRRRLKEREPLYSLAQVTCQTTGRGVAEIAGELAAAERGARSARPRPARRAGDPAGRS